MINKHIPPPSASLISSSIASSIASSNSSNLKYIQQSHYSLTHACQERCLGSEKGLIRNCSCPLWDCVDLDYILLLRLASISFVKLGFVNQYLIHKLLFFTFKDHLYQAPINIFVKSQIENIPCFVDHTVSVVTIQVDVQYKSSQTIQVNGVAVFPNNFINGHCDWMSCNFHRMFFFGFFTQPFIIVKITPKELAIQKLAVSWIWPTGQFAKP